jgi:homoserine kinase type II
MSVYTNLSQGDIESFLTRYAVGELTAFAGIADGIENTNYFVTTTGGEFVLTLFEAMDPADLPFCLDIMAHLAERGLPTPHPIPQRGTTASGNAFLGTLKGRPAAMVRRLAGKSIRQSTPAHCQEIGATLGRMHQAGADFPGERQNPRGRAWRAATAERIRPLLAEADRAFLDGELAALAVCPCASLPRGVIHADLFRDNVLFTDRTLTGLIDFYYACRGVLLYDVAVTVNDWCCQPSGEIDPARASPLLAAYTEERPPTAAEHAAWPGALRAAALRFWLSRLDAHRAPRAGELTHLKDPTEFERIVKDRAAQGEALCALWP